MENDEPGDKQKTNEGRGFKKLRATAGA